MLSLRDYGIKFPEEYIVATPEECMKVAEAFGSRRVALKVKSDSITHKTDAGGVLLGLSGTERILDGYHQIIRNVSKNVPSAKIDGITVQEMVPAGIEIIIGLTKDPVFGPCIMFGLGGVYTELFRDVVFRALPINRHDARDMIDSLKNGAVLRGFRGGVHVNLDMVENLLVRVGSAGWDYRDQLGSVDLNPVILWEDDYRVVDEKVLLEDPQIPGEEKVRTSHLSTFFEAKSVAVIGATETEGKIGRYVMDSISKHDYKGTVYPVNPNRKEVFGLKCCTSIEEIPEAVDLTVVTVPLDMVPSIMRQCPAKTCHNMVIVSGGGKEIGGLRVDVEREIRELSDQLDIRVIGCNCIGVFDGDSRLDTFFQTHERMVRPRSGGVSMITQSGTVGAVFLEAMMDIGVCRFVSFGNRIDVDEADLIGYLAEDDRTKAIAMYSEGLERGRALVEAAKKCSKPIVMYKAARTKAGANAAASHTGFYGGSYEVASGVFEQAGIVLVDSIEELVAGSKAIGCLPPAKGNRIALISNGAGTTVQALDLAEQYSLAPATLSALTTESLRTQYPSFYQIGTVVDVTGSATVRDYEVGIAALESDPGIDIIMPWFVLQDTPLEDSIPDALVRILGSASKPVVCGAAGGPYTEQMRNTLERNGIPLFETVREWVAAAYCLSKVGRQVDRDWALSDTES